MTNFIKHTEVRRSLAPLTDRFETGLIILFCGVCVSECVFPVTVLMKAHWHSDHRAWSHWGTSLINTGIIRVPL